MKFTSGPQIPHAYLGQGKEMPLFATDFPQTQWKVYQKLLIPDDDGDDIWIFADTPFGRIVGSNPPECQLMSTLISCA